GGPTGPAGERDGGRLGDVTVEVLQDLVDADLPVEDQGLAVVVVGVEVEPGLLDSPDEVRQKPGGPVRLPLAHVLGLPSVSWGVSASCLVGGHQLCQPLCCPDVDSELAAARSRKMGKRQSSASTHQPGSSDRFLRHRFVVKLWSRM